MWAPPHLAADAVAAVALDDAVAKRPREGLDRRAPMAPDPVARARGAMPAYSASSVSCQQARRLDGDLAHRVGPRRVAVEALDDGAMSRRDVALAQQRLPGMPCTISSFDRCADHPGKTRDARESSTSRPARRACRGQRARRGRRVVTHWPDGGLHALVAHGHGPCPACRILSISFAFLIVIAISAPLPAAMASRMASVTARSAGCRRSGSPGRVPRSRRAAGAVCWS